MILEALTEEEACLLAILTDPSGSELAEFLYTDDQSPDGRYRLWDFQWCLGGETLLYTDGGRRQIKDVVGPVRLLTGGPGDRGVWVDAEVRQFGQDELWEIVLERQGVRRVLRATDRHRWFAGSGRADRRTYKEVTTRGLLPGDRLRPMAAPTEALIMERHAIQAGIVHGDGTKHRKKSNVLLHGGKVALGVFFDTPSSVPASHPTALYFGSLPGDYKTLLPDVRDSDRSVLWGWLAGYFATDGSVLPDGTCQMTSVSMSSMMHVRDVATALGIVVSGVGHRPRTVTLPNGKPHSLVELRVVLGAGDLPVDFFLLPAHRRRIESLGARRSRAVPAWKVVSVEATGQVEDVYCAVVEGTHSFVLDGDILTGNSYYHCDETYQADACGRGVGKSVSAILRACAWPFNHPGQEMLVTAPELSHLSLVTDKVEANVLKYRLLREMLKDGGRNAKANGIRKSPHWQVTYQNNARILSRLPGHSGAGVKGPHPLAIELDECFPAGTLVLTHRGQVAIQEVVVGDLVLTHRGNWRPVEKVWDRGERDAVTVRGQGHPGLTSSSDHPFYARHITAFSDPNRRQGIKSLAPPTWVPAADLTDHLWATPLVAAGLDTSKALDVIPASSRNSYDINPATVEFAWALGHFLAEGSNSSSYGKGGALNRSYWSVHVDEASETIARLEKAGIKARGRKVSEFCTNVLVTHEGLANWLARHVGRGALNKQVPAWVYSMPREYRAALLEGMVFGDGFDDPDPRYASGRWKVTTAGKAMAISLRLLAAGLDFSTSLYWNPPPKKDVFINGALVRGKGWYQVVGNRMGQGLVEGAHRWTRVRDVKPAPRAQMYDLQVAEDHSFVADGIVVHNCQDYPRRGFTELTETIKISEAGAIWRNHGVSNGIGDLHHDITSNRIKDMPFYIHRYIASHRPTWNDDERKAKIAMYGGSEESPDYVRNIFGEPGSANSPVFVLARLMACVQMNQTAWATEYNEQIYYRQLISGAELSDLKRIDENASIVDFLQIPGSHLDEQYTSYWGGMDVGFTNDPSEILIFGDVAQKGGKPDVSRLLTRISMKHIEAPEQGDMVRFLIRHYGRRFRFFGMDKSGNGLPVTQHLQRDPVVGKKVKGYNFTEKRAVAMEDRDLEPGESMEDLAIKKYVVEHATDLLRTWVDARAIELPYDDDLLGEWQAQGLGKSASEAQVRRYSSKADHTLDAGRMFALAKGLELIEAIMEEDNRQVPVIDVFF